MPRRTGWSDVLQGWLADHHCPNEGSATFRTAESAAGRPAKRRSQTIRSPHGVSMHASEEGVQEPRRRQPRSRHRHEAEDEVNPPEQGEPEPVGTGSVAAVDRQEDRDEQDGDRQREQGVTQVSEGDFRAAKATPADRTISSRVPIEKRGRLMAVTGKVRRGVGEGRLASASSLKGGRRKGVGRRSSLTPPRGPRKDGRLPQHTDRWGDDQRGDPMQRVTQDDAPPPVRPRAIRPLWVAALVAGGILSCWATFRVEQRLSRHCR